MTLYNPFIVKLYAFFLKRLTDPNWSGTELYYFIKDSIKNDRQIDAQFLLIHTAEKGFLQRIAAFLYNEYICIGDDFEYPHISDLKDEYMVWYLIDIVELLKHHGIDEKSEYIKELIELLDHIGTLYDHDEKEYFEYLYRRKQKFVNLYKKLFSSYKDEFFIPFREMYAIDLANRLLHDRIMCEYISQLILTIGFDGANEDDDLPTKWIDRRKIKEWVIKKLSLRDNKCAGCSLPFDNKNKPTLDHIVPLDKGGCNDLVNFQLLCKDCNGNKANKIISVTSSIPNYFKRNKTT